MCRLVLRHWFCNPKYLSSTFLDARALLLTERVIVWCVYTAHTCSFNYKSDYYYLFIFIIYFFPFFTYSYPHYLYNGLPDKSDYSWDDLTDWFWPFWWQICLWCFFIIQLTDVVTKNIQNTIKDEYDGQINAATQTIDLVQSEVRINPGGGHSHWEVIWVCAAYKTHLFTLISSSGDPQFHVNLPLRSP